ncbi:unnamed protein product [Clonostachys chloroleuca]|uniref:Zn(2)-C6 fungal-type domain-containing protein n=1 Tax=Clonostachys chloroleuca TaxID=1926264 RepID=A0AA35M897_9HYPO|nr:unnamed protein product [Clonostachys chloroleuca]
MDEAVGDIDLDDNLLVPRKQLRRIACVRCRRRKKRCDHALPVCGECRKAGLLECIQSGVVRQGSSVTIPLAYLRHLEEGLSQSPPGSAFYQNQRDGVDATDSTKHDTSGGSSTGGLPRDLSPVELGPQTAYPSPAKDAAFSHTGYRATSTVHASDCVGEPAPGTSCLAQKQYAESATAAAGSRIVLDGKIAKALPLAWAEHYASIYFQHMQPQWPFMDQASWYSSFAAWLDDPNSLTRPSRFLVRLVVSIGALVCSSFRPNCPHLQNSQSTYRSALQYDLGDLMRSKSMLPRTQGALLLLVYAFHGSSPEPIEQCLRFAMMNCVSLITELEEQPEHQRREVDAQNSRNIYQSVVMSCHILNEVVSSGWTYPQDLMGEIGDDKSRIRHDNRRLRYLDLDDPLRRRCHTRFKAELEEWKRRVQSIDSPESCSDPIYHAPNSLFKLYDYSLAILMQDKPFMTVVENINELVRCCSEACCTFQVSQEYDPIVYWTWASKPNSEQLMYQFRLGILVLYCYLITPNAATEEAGFPLQEAIDGVQNCRKTLLKFSLRWAKSMIFLDAFQILTETVCDGPTFGITSDDPSFMGFSSDLPSSRRCHTNHGDRLASLEECILEMKLQKVHSAVISLIQEMIIGMQARETDTTQLPLAPALYHGGLDLFNF